METVATFTRSQGRNISKKVQIFNFSILMVGPTGSGKTEIARRLSKLTDSPYIKVLKI